MKHIDVYITYKFGHKFIPELQPKHVSMILFDILEYPCSVERLEQYFHDEPKTNYVVNALHDKGIQAKTIAEWLNMNKSTVSYHLANPIKKPYINSLLRNDILEFDTFLTNKEYNE